MVDVLAQSSDVDLLVQSAATLGSFACGVEAGLKAVVDSGVVHHLVNTLTNDNNKVGG